MIKFAVTRPPMRIQAVQDGVRMLKVAILRSESFLYLLICNSGMKMNIFGIMASKLTPI